MIDFTAFRGSAEDHGTGMVYITRGITHLLFYRIVYHLVIVDPSKVADLGSLSRWMIGTFLLYARISGEFHLIIGMLRLFGFRLPPAHRLYFLAAGFNDLWRRYNTYWRELMMSSVFYPLVLRLRQIGERRVLVLGVMLSFAATWVLHSYQWFWLRGSFPISAPDGVFWLVSGVLAAVSALREQPRPPRRWDSRKGWRTAVTVSGFCALWSIWSSESIQSWAATVGAGLSGGSPAQLMLPAILLVAIFVLGGFPQRAEVEKRRGTTAVLAGLVLLGVPQVQDALPGPAKEIAAVLGRDHLNETDAMLSYRGYYESLDDTTRYSTRLWETPPPLPPDVARDLQLMLEYEPLEDEWEDRPPFRRRSDLRGWDLAPNQEAVVDGVAGRTNSFGMRDREYPREKPPGTHRILLFGASDALGLFVGEDEDFESLLEERLNRDLGPSRRFEILNLGVPGYTLVQQVAYFEEVSGQLSADAAIFVVHPEERHAVAGHLARVLRGGVPITDPALARITREIGVETETDLQTALLAARARTKDILAWCFGNIASTAAERRIRPFIAHVALPGSKVQPDRETLDLARAAGLAILDAGRVFDGLDAKSYQAKGDVHPNAAGHRFIAGRLYEEIARQGL